MELGADSVASRMTERLIGAEAYENAQGLPLEPAFTTMKF